MSVEAHQLDALRQLLLEEEQVDLESLRERLDNLSVRAEEVAGVLPTAFALGSDDRLASAMMPTVESALHESANRNPQALADAIFPVMGPAIRRSIRDAIGSLVENVNTTIESRFTARGLKWRLEAKRSGRTYAEVALAHSLLYHVEEIYLIHKETGLLLLHVQEGSATQNDADLVSGMLTAIQDFVRDSFRMDDGEVLEQFQVGDVTVMVEQGPSAVLAAVVRGTPPPTIRPLMQEALEEIHRRHASVLKSFDGDAAALMGERSTLESCLVRRDKASATKKKRRFGPFGFFASVVLLSLLIYSGYVLIGNHIRRRTMRERWNKLTERIEAEPGMSVGFAHEGDDGFTLLGLRDPHASDPASIIEETLRAGDPVTIRWIQAAHDHPKVRARRLQERVASPPGVSIEANAHRTALVGVAPRQWIERTRERLLVLPGLASVDTRDLLAEEDRPFHDAIRAVQSLRLRFPEGASALSDAMRVSLKERVLAPLAAIAGHKQHPRRIDLYVRSALGESSADNAIQGRMNAVVHFLEQSGLRQRGNRPERVGVHVRSASSPILGSLVIADGSTSADNPPAQLTPGDRNTLAHVVLVDVVLGPTPGGASGD